MDDFLLFPASRFARERAVYETQINTALQQASTELSNAVSRNAPEPAKAAPFLREALTRLAGDLPAHFGIAGVNGLLPVVLASNFLTRAALDLYGPSRCAALLAERGEWSISDRYRVGGVRSVAWSVGRSLLGSVVTQPETETDRVWAYMNHIIDEHVKYVTEVVAHIKRDRTLLNSLFGVTGTLNGMTFTGSDPHRCARRVVLLRFSCGGRVVYKPTDLTFQLQLMGDATSYARCKLHYPALQPYTDSLFTALGMDMPTMRIAAFPSRMGEYGYMQFITKAGVIPTAGHSTYFRKLGKLIAVAAIFGLTDLHEENVMATANGPWLIDAEMGFSYPGPASDYISHASLQRVLNIKPETYSVLGGCFSPYYDDQSGTWDAATVSMPYDQGEVNAGFKATAQGDYVKARIYAPQILLGIHEGVDGVAARLAQVHDWIGQLYAVKPLARVLLNTTDMANRHVSGVTDLLNGTLMTEAQALAGSMNDWLTWYGGKNGAVPGAWFQPHSRQVLYDPTLQLGVPYVTAAAGGVSVANLPEVWNAMNRLSVSTNVATLKQTLKTSLEARLGCGQIRTDLERVARSRLLA
ncbi:DUF4135 domain-containing protein [Archangium gephyra]|nr:DUF4135 domain-containing protein [Archangium gephyra]